MNEHIHIKDLARVRQGAARARGRTQHQPGTMNQLEKAYSALLEEKRIAGEVLWWGFECIKFRLGHNCFYNPDFLVQTAEGFMEIHETKGYMEEDARVKLFTCATQFPMYRFVKVTKKAVKEGGDWVFEEIKR